MDDEASTWQATIRTLVRPGVLFLLTALVTYLAWAGSDFAQKAAIGTWSALLGAWVGERAALKQPRKAP